MTIRPSSRSRRRAPRVWITLISATVALLAGGQVMTASAEPGDPEALRRDLIGFASALAQQPAAESAAAILRERVTTADGDAMQKLADALEGQPGWPATRDVLRSLGTSGARAPIVEPGPPSVVCGPQRVPTEVIFGVITGRSVFEIVAAGFHAACDVTVAGFNAAPFCVAAGVLDGLVAGAVLFLDIEANCAGEADSLAHDAAIDTQAGMATQLDSLETKLDANGGAAQRTAERQLERQVRACEPLVSLVLPRAFGGALEDVRDLVVRWLRQAQLAGVGDIPEATKRLQVGNDALETNEYRTAYRSFCLAYRALLPR